MGELVYILCALTCATCCFLLTRAYLRTRMRLLLWSSLCFAGLTLNNVLLFVDLILLPQVDLSLWRAGSSLGSLLLLVVGLIWESP